MNIKEWLGNENQLGIDIWEGKYQKDGETFDEWLDRISDGNKDLRDLIIDKKFLFGGRILSNRGMDKRGQKITLSNCYVIAPPEDSIESIFECATKLARTYSYGGGCGVDLSKLAPRGAKVNNTAKYTTGSVSFMDLYSLVTGLIGQNGRRGALMLSISSDHPDLEEFISVKTDLNRVTKANISIRVTDEFMKAVEKGEDYILRFVREETGEEITKTVNARDIFLKLAETNWDYAEPGILYWDNIEKRCLLERDKNFQFAGTNPCAEEPLPAGGSCLLGSLNLAEFVKDGKFDYVDFRRAVHIAVGALNDVLDEGLPLHPLQEQRDSVRDWRQIGLGIFGLADMLIKMGLTYGDREALHVCNAIGFHMAKCALEKSALLAKERGPYPMYDRDAVLYSEFLKENTNEYVFNLVKDYGLHNSQLLTIAPTGTLSTMLGVSGGIEPIFANYYERKTESLHGEDVYYKVYTPIVKAYMEANHISDDKDLPEYFITAKDLHYNDRINMQGAWQDHIDASISSTVNLSNDATVEDVADLYLRAWKRGLKGITIFRDGCARLPILSTNERKQEEEKLERGHVIKASDRCVGKKRTLITGCGTLHCEAFFDPDTGELRETYLSKGSSGGCNNFMIGLSRMISLAARGGVSIEDILDQLMSSGTCPSYAVRMATKKDTSKGSCCPVAVANALRSMYDEMQDELGKVKKPEGEKLENKSKCPSCGEPLIFEGGCNSCKACGWSKCDL